MIFVGRIVFRQPVIANHSSFSIIGGRLAHYAATIPSTHASTSRHEGTSYQHISEGASFSSCGLALSMVFMLFYALI